MTQFLLHVAILFSFPYVLGAKEHNSSRKHHNHSIGFDALFESSLEEFEDEEIHFEKPLPEWLRGTMMKNGPGRFEFGERNVSHLFDGFAKLLKVHFKPDGTVTFSTKFIQSNVYRKSSELDDIAPYLLFEQPRPEFNLLQNLFCIMRSTDNMNINIYKFDKDFVTVSDTWSLYTVNETNLCTIEKINPPVPHGGLSGEEITPLSSSHPMKEHGTNNWINFASMLEVDGARINVVRFKSAREREFIAEIKTNKMPYMHSFAMTRDYVILMAHPMYFHLVDLLSAGAALRGLKWDGDSPMEIYVIHLKTGNVQKLETEARFLVHFINGYEIDSNTLVVDYTTAPDLVTLASLDLDMLLDPKQRDKSPWEKCEIRRYVIHLDQRKVVPIKFKHSKGMGFTNRFEFPIINEKFRYKRYCYAYGLTMKANKVSMANFRLVKKNVCDSSKDLSWHKANHYPTEATFVPRPNSLNEDDGVLLNVVLDGKKRKSYIGVFDPKTMQLVNKAYLPTAVPYPFHGRFFD